MISKSFTSAPFLLGSMHIVYAIKSILGPFPCSSKYNQSSTEEAEMHFIRLLDDQTVEFISTYPLDQYEYGCSILSCPFLMIIMCITMLGLLMLCQRRMSQPRDEYWWYS